MVDKHAMAEMLRDEVKAKLEAERKEHEKKYQKYLRVMVSVGSLHEYVYDKNLIAWERKDHYLEVTFKSESDCIHTTVYPLMNVVRYSFGEYPKEEE